MAHRKAGNLITDYNASYIPPALMPGYRGHVPTTTFLYGDTYGNTTKKYFQDFRSTVLEASQSPYSTGGQFPTVQSFNPSLMVAHRSRERDRVIYTPQWSKNNIDSSRQQELEEFHKLSQKHRENYNDKSGTVPEVGYFILPD
ncbi:protein FAM166C A [Erpetoichthys calabaricus]|uniref:Ciliary microtubule inner protein 2C n=1 Tax=Erpetoichthys calabaricus TaxID=27687 RepID=A0A8C4RUF1_ERPCA|nr:protein FAM166C A [Erpetoichthys calabaricus]